MPIHIDQLNTDVIPEPDSGASSAEGPSVEPWVEEERTRDALWRVSRDSSRTRAEGFDD